MLCVISPAKSLDLETPLPDLVATRPQFSAQAAELARVARTLGADDLRALMDLSEPLALLNVGRFRAFRTRPRPDATRPALFTFNGDVYQGFDAASLPGEQLEEAQARIRILSGLYGLLRPLDAIQPYRLEMGVALRTPQADTLYGFWGERVTRALARELKRHADRTLVNLASQEYFGVVQPKGLPGPVITPQFKEVADGQARIVSFFAKRARGMMARFVVDARLDRPEGLKDFTGGGYRFDAAGSTATHWLFTRPAETKAARASAA